ncbi:hypothetical protein BFDFBN_BFDFBN_06805, partial [Dysosmobacter welbionis]
ENSQEVHQVEAQDQAGEHDGHRGAQLDEDIQGRAGGVLEGVAHRIAHDGGLVALGALAAVVAALNILLGVVPGTAGVGHEHRHGKAGDGHAAQQAHHAGGAQHQASSQRHDDGQQGRHHHLMQGTLGAQGHAGGVVRVCLVLHDARDLLELAADLHHDGLGRLLHRAHGEGGEDEGQHGADEHAHQHRGAGQGEVQHLLRVLLDDVHVADQQ